MDGAVEFLPDHLVRPSLLPGGQAAALRQAHSRKAAVSLQNMRAENEAELIECERGCPVARADKRKNVPSELGDDDVILANCELIRANGLSSVVSRDLVEARFRYVIVHVIEAGSDPTDRIGLKIHYASPQCGNVGNI